LSCASEWRSCITTFARDSTCVSNCRIHRFTRAKRSSASRRVRLALLRAICLALMASGMPDNRAVNSSCSAWASARVRWRIWFFQWSCRSVCSQIRVRTTSSLTSSRTQPAFSRYTIRLALKASMASIEVTLAVWGMTLMLGQILLDALGFPQQKRRVLAGNLHEFQQRLHGLPELFGELGMLLVLPGLAQRGEPGLQQGDSILKIQVETFEFLGETPHLGGIHDRFRHIVLLIKG